MAKLKRWKLRKCNIRTLSEVEITAPEPLRHYWTLQGARNESIRLNRSMTATGLPWRYEVARRR